MSGPAGLESWIRELREQNASDLTFQEIRKGVVALSRIYVQERQRIGKDVFGGAGKRAAFASFYTPLHWMLVREIVAALGAETPPPRTIFDYGCGLGAASAAWACAVREAAPEARPPRIVGYDLSSWAIDAARKSYAALGLRASLKRASLSTAPPPRDGDALVAAFSVNELGESRPETLSRLVTAGRRGAALLIVEPLAKRRLDWWDAWSDAFERLGGRADEWRFKVERPSFIAEMDRASGLDHRELTGRSLYLRVTADETRP